jgi:hypothetical protein
MKEAFKSSTFASQSKKRRLFLSLQMVHLSKEGMTFQMASLDCPRPCVFNNEVTLK